MYVVVLGNLSHLDDILLLFFVAKFLYKKVKKWKVPERNGFNTIQSGIFLRYLNMYVLPNTWNFFFALILKLWNAMLV